MPGAIDLVVVIEAETILETYSSPSLDPSAPTMVAEDCCYLIAPAAYAQRGLATAHLQLSVGEGLFEAPLLDWRSLSLSSNADFSAVIYRLDGTSGFPLARPSWGLEQQRWVPVPILVDGANQDPPAFEAVPETVYFLRTLVMGGGRRGFDVYFYLTRPDEDDGKPVLAGYFQWSAWLTLR